MALFKEYDSTIAYNYDILFRKFDIDSTRLENEIMFESTLEELDQELFCEAETLSIDLKPGSQEKKSNSKFKQNISDLSEKISRFISDVIEMISNMFSKSSHIDIETYLKTSEGKIQMEHDLEKVHKEVKDELRKGRKLIKAIANGTHISEDVINKYVDDATECIQKQPMSVVLASKTYAKYLRATDDIREMRKEMKEAADDCRKIDGDSEKEAKVVKVYKAMKQATSDGVKAYSLFSSVMYKEALEQEKKENKNKKKNKGGH